MRANLRQLWRDRSGATFAELTVVMPILMTLGFGIMEIGYALYGHHVVYAGIRDAARYLARLDDPVGSAAAGKQLAVYGEIGGSVKRLSWWNVADVSVTTRNVANPLVGGQPTYRGPDPIKIVKVSTTATYPGLGLLGFLGLGTSLTFTLHHEERGIGE